MDDTAGGRIDGSHRAAGKQGGMRADGLNRLIGSAIELLRRVWISIEIPCQGVLIFGLGLRMERDLNHPTAPPTAAGPAFESQTRELAAPYRHQSRRSIAGPRSTRRDQMARRLIWTCKARSASNRLAAFFFRQSRRRLKKLSGRGIHLPATPSNQSSDDADSCESKRLILITSARTIQIRLRRLLPAGRGRRPLARPCYWTRALQGHALSILRQGVG